MAEDAIILRPGPLAQIGRGIEARLREVFPANKFTLGFVPVRLDRAVWHALIQRSPAIALGFTGFSNTQTTSDLAVISTWQLYIATKNANGAEALLFGDTLAPGQLAVAEVAAAVLHGTTLKGLGTIQVVSANNAYLEDETDQTVSLTAIDLTVKADLNLATVLGGPVVMPAALRTIADSWNFGPGQFAQTDTLMNAGN